MINKSKKLEKKKGNMIIVLKNVIEIKEEKRTIKNVRHESTLKSFFRGSALDFMSAVICQKMYTN